MKLEKNSFIKNFRRNQGGKPFAGTVYIYKQNSIVKSIN